MNPLPKEITLVIHQEDGMFWTEIPDLPGCFASGRDIDELKEALAEAISMYVSDGPEARKRVRLQISPPADAKEIPARLQLAAA